MSQLHQKLAQDHAELHARLQQLAEDAEAPGAAALESTWDALETRLLRHMEAEERYLLPLLEASHAAEVERTRAEHARIRERIAELGVAIELHTVRKPEVLELVDWLTRHAAHEDQQLYRLASEKASRAVEHSVTDFLKGKIAFALSAGKALAEQRPHSTRRAPP